MNVISIIIFFGTCLLICLLEKFLHTRIPFIKWLYIIFFCLITANRSILVPDTENYIDYFTTTTFSFDDFNYYSFEIGFQIFSKLIKLIVGDNVFLYFFIITFINLVIIDGTIRRLNKISTISDDIVIEDNNNCNTYSSSILPLILYLAFYGIYFNCIVLRVGLSLSLIAFASTFMINETRTKSDYIIAILLLIIAYFIHATAILGILILMVLSFSKKLSIKNYVIIGITIGIIYFLNFSSKLGDGVTSFISSLNTLASLSTKLSNYEGNVTFDVGISFKFVFFWIFYFILLFSNIRNNTYYKYLNLYLLGLLLFALFRPVLLIERVTDFFLFFSFIVFYLFLEKQSSLKFMLYISIMIAMQLIFIIRITNRDIIT